ncbi:hypothetical protein [Streptomyces doebereineriae]|uniref:Uncharacterized protein n=1 Tax=Streptomyces doebereineriae TaxID=3075528 RepID=A0ABU2VFX3_9ACTN|nr:hypothetical protein [Streptomyces sp. DSM 41640]MDT0484459.1 hypothetical protein [Streptomyces sp. DSM 41640]
MAAGDQGFQPVMAELPAQGQHFVLAQAEAVPVPAQDRRSVAAGPLWAASSSSTASIAAVGLAVSSRAESSAAARVAWLLSAYPWSWSATWWRPSCSVAAYRTGRCWVRRRGMAELHLRKGREAAGRPAGRGSPPG